MSEKTLLEMKNSVKLAIDFLNQFEKENKEQFNIEFSDITERMIDFEEGRIDEFVKRPPVSSTAFLLYMTVENAQLKAIIESLKKLSEKK